MSSVEAVGKMSDVEAVGKRSDVILHDDLDEEWPKVQEVTLDEIDRFVAYERAIARLKAAEREEARQCAERQRAHRQRRRQEELDHHRDLEDRRRRQGSGGSARGGGLDGGGDCGPQ